MEVLDLDVTTIPREQRQERIDEMFDILSLNGTLRLTSDEDPAPIYSDMLQQRGGEMTWNAKQRGPDKWVVNITKIMDKCC